MAIAAALGENGFELWHERSRSSDRYARSLGCRRKARQTAGGPIFDVDFGQAFTVSATALLICSMPT